MECDNQLLTTSNRWKPRARRNLVPGSSCIGDFKHYRCPCAFRQWHCSTCWWLGFWADWWRLHTWFWEGQNELSTPAVMWYVLIVIFSPPFAVLEAFSEHSSINSVPFSTYFHIDKLSCLCGIFCWKFNTLSFLSLSQVVRYMRDNLCATPGCWFIPRSMCSN